MFRFYLFFSIACLSPIFTYAYLGDAQDSEHLKMEKIEGFDIDQVQIIDNLINIEEKKLELHKNLKKQIMDLKNYEETFFKDPENIKAAKQLVTTARNALSLIIDMKIEHLFSQSFLEDLEFYSSIAGSQKLSRPD